MITLVSSNGNFEIPNLDKETLRECLTRNGIPAYAVLAYNEIGRYLSLSDTLSVDIDYTAIAIRNPDLSLLQPSFGLIPNSEPVSELFLPNGNPWSLDLIQFSRKSGMNYIFNKFSNVINTYIGGYCDSNWNRKIQVALSSGGDGRVVAECLSLYREKNGDIDFNAVITSTDFEDEKSHIDSAVAIAETFSIPYSVYSSKGVSKTLGYIPKLSDITKQYRSSFPQDEIEVLGTYWVQEINKLHAKKDKSTAIIFGFNQEDSIADRLYQLMSGNLLDPYPIRDSGEYKILSPLHQVPKRLIDAMDLENSKRNYSIRVPSVSQTRSAIYFIAYFICERFPSLAEIIAGSPLKGDEPDTVLRWLDELKIETSINGMESSVTD